MILIAIAVIAVCLLFQAYFAGSEMAIISCNRIKLRHKAELGDRRARIVQRFLNEPEKFLGTTLVGYNVAVVIGSCVLNSIISNLNPPPGTENLITIAILLPLVLIGGQIVPMASGRQHANTLSLTTARPLRVAYFILFPLVATASLIARGISRLITGKHEHKNPFVSREELELILKESYETGVLERDEREMIEEIFDFSETSVKEVMVPLIDIIAAPETATVAELIKLIAGSGHTRIPIYHDRIDEVIGTVNATDLAGISCDSFIKDVIRSPYIVPESASIETVLKDLQRNKKHIAIAVDEFGGVSGILTLEDIIEEIVGEIEDEYDTYEGAEWERRPGAIVVDGKMHIDEFNEEFGQKIAAKDAETIAGFVTERLGKLPVVGDNLTCDQLSFRVTDATDRRVISVEIKGVKS